MSTYIIKHSIYSGKVIMNINGVQLSNDPVLSFTQMGNPITTPGKIGSTLALYYPYLAVGDTANQAVYIYKTDGTSWTLDATINTPEVNGTDFASSISMKDKVLAIGSPAYDSGTGRVYVYYLINNTWQTSSSHTFDIVNDGSPLNFGSSVHVSEHYIAVSAPGAKNADAVVGSVYLYQYNYVQNTYSLETTLSSNNPNSANKFGSSIGMLGDDTLIVSSPKASVTSGSTVTGAGFVEFFKKSAGTWAYDSTINSPKPTANGLFGSTMSAQIGRIVFGEPGANFIHTFDYQAPYWNIVESLSYGTTDGLDDSTVTGSDQQGLSVAQDVSERSFVWSAPKNNGSGTVYVAETTPAGNIVPSVTSKITASDSVAGELFGNKIAYDGRVLVCLAPGGNSGNGEIVVFTK